MKYHKRNQYTLSSPGGVFRVVQYFNSKGEEYLRQYYPVSKKAFSTLAYQREAGTILFKNKAYRAGNSVSLADCRVEGTRDASGNQKRILS